MPNLLPTRMDAHLARRFLLVAFAALVGAVVLALLWPGAGRGIVINWKPPAALGLVGLTEGQTLRISVANVVGFEPRSNAPTCQLQVGFVDADNNTIGDPTIFGLRPGVSRSFDHVALADGSVRPVVENLEPQGDCPAVVGVERFDRGATNGIIINYVPVDPGVFAKP